MTRKHLFFFPAVAPLLLLLATAFPAAAQEPAPAAGAAKAAKAPAAKPPQAAPAGRTDKTPLREQTIYVPYDELRKTFEKEGRGVFLPYEQFRRLWDAARKANKPPADQKPPVGALITEIENEATVSGDVVRVEALLKIEVLGKGWHSVPLRLADAAITEARLGDQPARLLSDGQRGYKLLLESKRDQPTSLQLHLSYAKAIVKAPGENSVSFEAPRAPVSRWRVRIPTAGVKIDIQPMIAATEEKAGAEKTESGNAEKKPAGDQPEKPEEKKPEETVILAFVGSAPRVRIGWTPKAEGATGLAALASVQVQQQVFVSQGVTRTHAQLAYTISRAELDQLSLSVPEDQKVVNVFDANVRSWSVQRAEGKQKITVALFEPAKGAQRLTVELEKFSGPATGPPEAAAGESDKAKETKPKETKPKETKPKETKPKEAKPAGQPAAKKASPAAPLVVPVIEALGVGRQQGVVVVQLSEGLRAQAATTGGLVQVDAADLPDELKGTAWAFSYRYAAVPFELTLDVEKVEPRVAADSLVEARLEPQRMTVDVSTVYTIQQAGVFRLEFDLPAGWEVRYVQGRAIAGAKAAAVDTHHLEGKDKTRLVVSLARKAFGRVGLALRLERDLDQPDLLAPTGKAAQIDLPVPRVAPGSVERSTGRLLVRAPEALRVNPDKIKGLRAVAPAEALEGMEPAAKGTAGRIVLAYLFGPEPTALTLAAERRRPQVTVGQMLVGRIEDGVVKYQCTLYYDVLYSGIKSLRLDVPEDVAGVLRNKTHAVREQVIDPPPDDLAAGYVAWSLTGETELLGQGRIELAWESKMDRLDIGSSVAVDVPRLVPRGVDRSWGQIVLTKAETVDIAPGEDLQGLRPIDPQHDLMEGVKVPGAAAAFEFHDDWSLRLVATRYELEQVKQTSIERAVLRMVVTRSGKTAVQALYRLRSAGQRLEIRMPKGSQFDADPRINGEAVTLELGQPGQFFVPLVESDSDKTFLLELRYTLGKTGRRLGWPEFPNEPAMQKVYLLVYLPEEIDLLDTWGPWTKEFGWDVGPAGRFRPANRSDDAKLLRWVCRPAPLPETFPVDGRLYVFSTVRPGDPTSDALRLMTLHSGYVDMAVLIVLIVGGLLLLAVSAGRRILAAGALAVGLIVGGVFWPLAAGQICDRTLLLPLVLVLVVWVVQYFVWTLPRGWRRRRLSQPKPAAVQPPPVPDVATDSGQAGSAEPIAAVPGGGAADTGVSPREDSAAEPIRLEEDEDDQPGTEAPPSTPDDGEKGGPTDG